MLLEIDGPDIWDPNNWRESDHEHRIYADEDHGLYCVVDDIDYSFLTQWEWSLHSRKRFEERGVFYLRRIITEFHMPDGPAYESPMSGKLVRNRHRTQYNRMLHTEIMLRTGIPQPTPEHKEVDHINKQTWNCRRSNLRWATRKEQVANSSARENMRKARAALWGHERFTARGWMPSGTISD